MIMIFGDNGIENNRYGYSADGTMIIMMIVIKRMEMLIIMTLVIIMILLDNFD